MEEGIQLIANFNDWKVVKKINISEKTPPFTILEFFASFMFSVEKKAEYYLEKTGSLREIEALIDTGQTLQQKFELIKSRQMSSLFNQFMEKINLEKKQEKGMKDILSIYAIRYALKKEDIKFSYGEAEVPSLKKIKKGK